MLGSNARANSMLCFNSSMGILSSAHSSLRSRFKETADLPNIYTFLHPIQTWIYLPGFSKSLIYFPAESNAKAIQIEAWQVSCILAYTRFQVFYGGDEVSALVFDIGRSLSKVGYAGEDCPRAVFPSYVGSKMEQMREEGKHRKKRQVLLGDANVYRETQANFRNPIQGGHIVDWDALESIWEYAYTERLCTQPENHPLLVSESAWAEREQREKMTELAFETFNVPAFYLSPSAVLAAFSAGRSNALVVDSGGEMTSVVPVYDAYVLKKGIQKQALAGDFISEQAQLYIQQELNQEILPQFKIASKQLVDLDQPAQFTLKDTPNVDPTFYALATKRAMNEFKETVCANLEHPFDPRVAQSRPRKTFEFPNGFNTALGKLRYQIPECLFDPKYILAQKQQVLKSPLRSPLSPNPAPKNEGGDPAVLGGAIDHHQSNSTEQFVGVQHLAHNSVQSCDPDIRTQMYTNVVLTGGNTLLHGFADRLHYELNNLAPGIKVRLHAAGSSVERKFGAWVGGSVLASLGTFHQLWISKQEYEENGASVIATR